MDKVNKQELRRLAAAAIIAMSSGRRANKPLVTYRISPDLPEGKCTQTAPDPCDEFGDAANPAAILFLLDELDQAEERIRLAEVAADIRVNDAVGRAITEHGATLAELEQYRKDAERYRWITENADVDCRVLAEGAFNSLDERIDAALAKEGGSNG